MLLLACLAGMLRPPMQLVGWLQLGQDGSRQHGVSSNHSMLVATFSGSRTGCGM
jgi:hypothetical protein